jgi:L-fuculose-phosphate aldolase
MEWQLRKTIVEIGALVHSHGFVAASDGNISVRLGPDRVLITPSGLSLGRLRPQDMVVIDAAGRALSGARKPSSEYRLHLMIYEERADVRAVVHAHPPVANGFTFAGVSLADCVIPEVVATIGVIPTSEYATPSTVEGANVARGLIRDYDVIMLQRHGSVTVGPTLLDAYHKLEKLEHSAQVLLTARTLGKVQPLSQEEVAKLARLREDMGLGSGKDVFRVCGQDAKPRKP